MVERGVVGALVGAFLFILVPAAISYGAAASFVAHYWGVFSLDLWQRAAIGALSNGAPTQSRLVMHALSSIAFLSGSTMLRG